MSNGTPRSETPRPRIGIDLGGTKIAGIMFDHYEQVVAEARRPAPTGDYAATLSAIAATVADLERSAGLKATVGIGMPGCIAPSTGRVQNANSTWLNDKPLQADLETRLGRSVRLANDANCFVLSEATDGAATGAGIVFGVIIGTGCGGGITVDGRLVDGPRSIAGEWGHTPLPWQTADEIDATRCWCGQKNCLETFVSGTGLARDHRDVTGAPLTGEQIVAAARAGDLSAQATLDRHADRLARGLALICRILDPHVIVLGGGLSQLQHLYAVLPALMAPYILAADTRVTIRPPKWGDASGVRGAARLWP
jgi:fructokinase